MIDFTKYNSQEMQAIVEVLHALTDDLISSDITESLSIPMREYRRALVAVRETAMLEAEPGDVNRIVCACIAPRVKDTWTDEKVSFESHIISEICNHAVANDFEPDEALAIISTDILNVLEIATFNYWKTKEV